MYPVSVHFIEDGIVTADKETVSMNKLYAKELLSFVEGEIFGDDDAHARLTFPLEALLLLNRSAEMPSLLIT